MYRIEGDFFIDERGNTARTIRAAGNSENPEWDRKQQESIKEYEETHLGGNLDGLSASLFDLFRFYISYYCLQLKAPPCILDVGCGMYPKIPPYIPTVSGRTTYVGLDPIRTGGTREYLFINAKIEDCPGLVQAHTFNLVVFCTSLDHIERIEEVSPVVRQLLQENSFVLFFIGLHDVKHVAPGIGASAYRRMFSRIRTGNILIEWAINTLSIPHLWRSMVRRHRSLMRREPLDGLHFHYFTEDSIREIIGSFGELIDVTHVPHTNALFMAVRRK